MEMPAQQSEQQRPLQTLDSNGSYATVDETQGSHSPCHGVVGSVSKDGETSGYPTPNLPEDIWFRIHSLMPMDAAARAACLSHAFLSSWRCYPKLTLTREALRLKCGNLSPRIDSILRNHSGIGLKKLRLKLRGEFRSFPHIDRWLQVAVKPGIEELTLSLDEAKEYKFPCSLLSNGVANSIRYLQLVYCVFCPSPELGTLRSLTRLELRSVRITGDELELLLSNSLALENLDLTHCNELSILKIPSALKQLSYLSVTGCNLRVIENKAPSLSNFTLFGQFSKLSLGEASEKMKVLALHRKDVVYYARAKLASIMPNLETLSLTTDSEVDTPMLPTKFLNLKHLTMQIWTSSYDYFSLVSFLDASPSLVTWILEVAPKDMEHESIFEGSSHLRQLPEIQHDRLKSVEIIGFSSAKSLVELTCCIIKSAVSLEQLTLDTLDGDVRCSGPQVSYNKGFVFTTCSRSSNALLEKASRGVAAIREYIEDKVPPTAKLTVLEPCPRCHTTKADQDEGLRLS